MSEITDMVREAFAIDKEARRLAREEAITALRAAVEEIESMQASTWASDALDVLRKHLAPWLGEEKT